MCMHLQWLKDDFLNYLNDWEEKCRSLRRRLKLHPTPYLTSKLHELESELGSLIHSSKLAYERDLCFMYQNDPGKLFHYFRELSHPKSSLYPIIHNSQPVVDPHIKASLFNSYFNSVFTTSDFILPPIDSLPSPTDQLSSIVIDASDVFEAISSLNPSKAPGIDDINPAILKICADPFLLQFTHLLNRCLDSFSFPNDWKIHKITQSTKERAVLMLPTIGQYLCCASRLRY